MGLSNQPYSELKNLVQTGRVNIRLILSPPRTGSTLVEAVFSRLNENQQNTHEPFVELGYYGGKADDGYQRFLNLARQDGGNKPTTIQVKEMSHWLGTNNEHNRFFDLINDPVLVLIRNPLLCLESRIRKVLQVWGMKEKPELLQHFGADVGLVGDDFNFQRGLNGESIKFCWHTPPAMQKEKIICLV